MTITINGTTGIAGVDGSASTPAVQGTDTNTGIVFPAADTVTIATGGSERVRVDSSGNMGIGTSSPGVKLNVVTSGTTQVWVESTDTNKAILSINANNTEVALQSTYNTGGSAARPLKFYNVSTAMMSMDAGKSVALEGATSQTGTGITFPATQSASTDANTLDDYEEGTWTPTDASGASLSLTVTGASYVKIGKQVTAWFWITYPSTANASNAVIGSLPFTVGAYPMVGAGVSGYTSYTATVTAYPIYTTTNANLVINGGTAVTNANLSTKELRMCLFYTV